MAFINKHTKGDWIPTTDGEANFYGISTGNNWLLRVQQNGELSVAEQEVNIKLISVAPKLREYTEMLYDMLEDGVMLKKMIERDLIEAGVEII